MEEQYSKLKVPELKDLLREQGLPVSGKKDDLIARLIEASMSIVGVDPNDKDDEDGGEGEGEGEQGEGVVDAPPTASNRNGNGHGHAREEEEEGEEEREVKRVKIDEPDQVMEEVSEPVKSAEEVVVEESTTSAVDPAPKEEEGEQETKVEEQEEPPEYNFSPEPEDATRATDMYLDTINRNVLDFDFERLCSVTLSHNNIYACLVNGKYFQGRGKQSPAYAHSIAEDNHVFINLTTQKVYVLPDGYEVSDPSLDDIKYLLFPTFTPQLLSRIDRSLTPSYDLSKKPYYPGFVGLNNIKANSYMNSILFSLLHVIPLRNYFILDPLPGATELVKRFSMLCRKVWNPKAFKGQVSPHELLQECVRESGKRFKITEEGDPLEFLGWLLNALHKDLGGTKKSGSSVIYSAFQGMVRIDDQQIVKTGEHGTKPRFDIDREIKSTTTPFLFLTLDLPAPPLFQDVSEKNIIPQVPLSLLLSKYDGQTTQEVPGKETLRRFKIIKLPPFLIVHVKRFTKNNFVEEKNQTIVNFPLRGVEMKDYVESTPNLLSTHYDLVSNLTHSSLAGTVRDETVWKTHVHLRPSRDPITGELEDKKTGEDEQEKWFEMQDLIVEEINRGMISLGESYIQIWERRGAGEEELKVEVHKSKKKGLGTEVKKV